jgi:hypothetical protein
MRLISFACLGIAVLLGACATQFPAGGQMARAKGYPGPDRIEQDVATIFATDARPRWDVTFICTVDGRALERPGCANVVYLSPGTHTLGWEYRGTSATGRGELAVVVEAGRVYQLNASSLGGSRGIVQLMPMSQSAKLTYRNVSPSQIPEGVKPDDPVPYGAN